jgi:4-hydroxyphenylacetate 3-monooxygenase
MQGAAAPIRRVSDEYSERLNDGRRVLLNGRYIEDVAQHVAFSGAVESVAAYYALQKDDPEVNCAVLDCGTSVPISLRPPASQADLAANRASYKAVADVSHGMLGRTPDFMNAVIMAIGMHSEILGDAGPISYAENARRYHRDCCRTNRFVAHASINPQVDRTVQLGKSDCQFVGVHAVDENKDGIVVRGAKMIATLAPIADELLIFNMPGLVPGDERFAVAFAIPVSTPGVTLVCRKSIHHAGYSQFDHPLANRFDEIDSYVLFEDVKVPWDRVFVYRDVGRSNAFYDATFARQHGGHQGNVRGLAKGELAVGTALQLAEAFEMTGQPAIQESLGRLASDMEVLRSLIHLSEAAAVTSPAGVVTPSVTAIQSFRLTFPNIYRNALEVIRSLVPGSMLSVPSDADFSGDLGATLMAALGTKVSGARKRSQLLNLAWDLVGDAFGQRQLTYEFYHAGAPGIIAKGQFRNYGWDRERGAVAKALEW